MTQRRSVAERCRLQSGTPREQAPQASCAARRVAPQDRLHAVLGVMDLGHEGQRRERDDPCATSLGYPRLLPKVGDALLHRGML